MLTIVVCGATGNQGRAVVAALKGRARIKALVRDRAKGQRLLPAGTELVDGNLNDRASLERAFAGADGVFGVTQPWSADYRRADVAAEIAQGKALIEACRASGARLVLSTVLRSDDQPTGIPHVDSKLEIEQTLRASGTPHVILGPASFMDNIGLEFFPVRKGKVRGFTDGDAKVPLIACRDIGRAAAAAFEQFDAYRGKLVNLIGGLYSGDDICATLGKLRGGERFRWSAPPALLMRLFAKEFYKMRRTFEQHGRPPFPALYEEAMKQTLALVPERFTLEDFLREQGWASKAL